jgi:hypothetical protein
LAKEAHDLVARRCSQLMQILRVNNVISKDDNILLKLVAYWRSEWPIRCSDAFLYNRLMDTATIISELEAERDRINGAITALNGSNRKRPGPRPGASHLSAEGRRKISLAQKKRWAQQKKK